MMSFARVTKLTNVMGRSKYIGDPSRQEDILCHAATTAILENGWGPVAEFEKQHQKSAQKNNQGREIIVQLPNEWAYLSRSTMVEYTTRIAWAAIGREMPFMELAVHWNHARTNLHLHIIFSERPISLETAKRYDRDIYHTPDGKVARKRAERARDKAGNELPPVHRKGELVNPAGFGPKLKEFKAQTFPEQARERAAAEFRRLGVALQEPLPYFLHEYHEGKGSESRAIATKNAGIRAYNACIAFFVQYEILPDHVLKALHKAALADLRANLAPRVHDELFAAPEWQQKIRKICDFVLKQQRDNRAPRPEPRPSQQRPMGLDDVIRQARETAAKQNVGRRPSWHRRGIDLER